MTVSREDALDAMMNLTHGAHTAAEAIPQLILDHPELDPEIKEILEVVKTVVPLLSSVATKSFVRALDAEDVIDQLNDWIAKNVEIKK